MNLPGSLSGKLLGKYQVLERIGFGGMAEVYHGRHESLSRDVAIKILHPALMDDPQFITRFEREARLVANLRHPSIVQMYDFDTQGGQIFMVMEFITGGTLKQRLEEMKSTGRCMPLSEIEAYLGQLASALDYAHAHNMLHRDLKPANILLDPTGNVFLTDFGIAHLLGSHKLTSTGALLGTPAYMSPEQCRGDELTTSSDLYSLAVILFEMVTGEVPFKADSPLGLIQKQINQALPPLDTLRKDLPTEIDIILHKALSKNPQERYQTAHELFIAFSNAIPRTTNGIEFFAGQKNRPAQKPLKVGTKKARKTSNYMILAGIILVVAIIIGGSVIWAAKQTAAGTVKRCSTPLGCQTIAKKLIESERFVLASEALEKAVTLVPTSQQPLFAQLKCDQGDVFNKLGNRLDARGAYRECINWTHNDPQLQSIRDYAQQKIKDFK
jgi:serine/threonine protein kinase